MANQIVLNKIAATATILDVVAIANLVNGSPVLIGTQNADKTYNCATPTAITNQDVAIVLSVPLSYGVEKTENEYVITAGDIVRAYVPYKGMTFSIPVANLLATTAVAVGAFAILDAGAYILECVASLGGTESLVFEVDEVFTKAGVSMAKLRCVAVA